MSLSRGKPTIHTLSLTLPSLQSEPKRRQLEKEQRIRTALLALSQPSAKAKAAGVKFSDGLLKPQKEQAVRVSEGSFVRIVDRYIYCSTIKFDSRLSIWLFQFEVPLGL